MDATAVSAAPCTVIYATQSCSACLAIMGPRPFSESQHAKSSPTDPLHVEHCSTLYDEPASRPTPTHARSILPDEPCHIDFEVRIHTSSRTPRPSQPALLHPSRRAYPKNHPDSTRPRHPVLCPLFRLTPRQRTTARRRSSCGFATSTCRRRTSHASWPY